MGSYRKKSAVVAVLGLVVLAVGLFSSSAGASTSKCLVINSRLDQSYSSLQAGVDAAPAGGTLWVRGTCVGVTTIGKNLTVTGQHPRGFTAPTLDGGGNAHVLTITAAAQVAINTLTIRNGDAELFDTGGGIYNQGTLTITGATITANAAYIAGAIYNSGTLTLNGSTSVTGNLGKYCAGIVNDGGTLTLNGSASISHNTAYEAGGLSNGGTATLNDSSSITGNNSAFDAGGVLNGGTLTLNGYSSVSGNSSDAGVGGGIFNNGTVTLNGSSSVTGNTAAVDGGGIYNEATLEGAVPGAGGNVYNNSPNDIAP